MAVIRLIAAIDEKRGIAKNGSIPWDLPADAKYYVNEIKKYGGFNLMGRKTLEEHKKIPKDRKIFVVTTQQNYNAPVGVSVVNDLEQFLAKWDKDLWIVGGQKLFEDTLNIADELYITEIEADFDCDRFFPEYKSKFKLKTQSETYQENGLKFRFEVWVKK